MEPPTKVVVIGGGCGAMAAAFELTRPEHNGRFSVTVYQEGWRLGGKGASGRGPSGRIEEHGLHVWLGFYDNAFAMMRDCYAELAATGCSDFGDWRDAFLPESDIGLFGTTDTGGWQRWSAHFPARPGLPGDPVEAGEIHSLAGYIRASVTLLMTLLLEVDVGRTGDVASPVASGDGVDRVVGVIRTLLGRGVFVGAAILVEALAVLRVAIGALPKTFDGLVLRLTEAVAGGTRQWLEDHLLADDAQRHVWELADIVLATLVGCLRHGLLTDPRGLEAIDEYDIRDWLRLNGASERALSSPYIEGLYDLALAYEDGDPSRPRFAAGQGMRGGLRMFFSYRGSLFWRMRAGMGDIVFAPMYELLRRRGVSFEFFHRLTNVGLPPGGAILPGQRTHVASLEFDVQADVAGYEPLVEVAGRPCWPSRPRFETLADYESHWDRTRVGELRLEVTRDFDFVVLGVSVGAVPHVCTEILARDARWRRMVAEVKTVATQAFQVWLDEDLDALGWHGPPYLASGFVKPFDSWCDMAHVIPDEGWSARPATAVYFCGVLRDPADPAATDVAGYPARRFAEVHDSAIKFLAATARPMWPAAYDAHGEFRWEILADASGAVGATGRDRFATQYWRANVNPSDRYVLSLPGSLKHRISPLDMTYENLTVAGDWTRCGLETGCTEAAVMSGRLAAHALSGLPRLADITGYDHP